MKRTDRSKNGGQTHILFPKRAVYSRWTLVHAFTSRLCLPCLRAVRVCKRNHRCSRVGQQPTANTRRLRWRVPTDARHASHGQQCNDTHTNDFFAFLSGNLTPLFLHLQYILNVFKFRSFVTSLSLSIAQKLTPENVLEVSILPPILSKRDET